MVRGVWMGMEGVGEGRGRGRGGVRVGFWAGGGVGCVEGAGQLYWTI